MLIGRWRGLSLRATPFFETLSVGTGCLETAVRDAVLSSFVFSYAPALTRGLCAPIASGAYLCTVFCVYTKHAVGPVLILLSWVINQGFFMMRAFFTDRADI